MPRSKDPFSKMSLITEYVKNNPGLSSLEYFTWMNERGFLATTMASYLSQAKKACGQGRKKKEDAQVIADFIVKAFEQSPGYDKLAPTADDSAFQQFIDNAFQYQQEFENESNGECPPWTPMTPNT